ncbi:hypothetical protein CCR95_18270 [Thiocystis minor]|nr:hypothetical protein [Thiocystis minor]
MNGFRHRVPDFPFILDKALPERNRLRVVLHGRSPILKDLAGGQLFLIGTMNPMNQRGRGGQAISARSEGFRVCVRCDYLRHVSIERIWRGVLNRVQSETGFRVSSTFGASTVLGGDTV